MGCNEEESRRAYKKTLFNLKYRSQFITNQTCATFNKTVLDIRLGWKSTMHLHNTEIVQHKTYCIVSRAVV